MTTIIYIIIGVSVVGVVFIGVIVLVVVVVVVVVVVIILIIIRLVYYRKRSKLTQSYNIVLKLFTENIKENDSLSAHNRPLVSYYMLHY